VPVIVTAALLASCGEGAGQAAERQYEMVKRAGASNAELCDAARKVEQAWLSEENEEKYRDWSIRRGMDCNAAEIDRL